MMPMCGGFRLVAAAMLLLLAGCAGKHVHFFPQNLEPDAAGETRLFLDARGHLYPETGLPADPAVRKKHQGSLFETAYDSRSGVCDNAAAGTEMAMLCAAVSRKNCASWAMCGGQWEIAQQALWQRRGQEIAAASARDGDTMLVFLIHGFNNWYEESQPNFDNAEEALKPLAPAGQKVRFIEIFWDGCRGSDTGVGCWGKAQATGPLAGFSLRQLFNAIDQSWQTPANRPHMRVLTHSSGAFVASAIFGNPTAALPLLKKPTKNERYKLFAAHASATSGPYRIPQPRSLKVAMLAAATPYASYSGSDAYPGGVAVRNLELLISVHPRDRAITKLGIIDCKLLGASCLGARREDVCSLTRRLKKAGKEARVTGYDFRRDESIWGKEASAHDFSVYIRQASHHSSFFRDFMAIETSQHLGGTEGLPFECPK